MTRITLRLPEDLSDRLRNQGRKTGASLNQIIVNTLRAAVADSSAEEAVDPLTEEIRRVRWALRDLIAVDSGIDFAGSSPLAESAKPKPAKRPAPPRLNPPLSATIIEDRRDRV